MDDVITAATFATIVALALGLSYWANRARFDRSALVGLYLLLGFPGFLLAVWGLAAVVYGQTYGRLLLPLGLGLGLPLLAPVRRFLARLMPIDPDSPVDMVGSSLLLGAIAFFAVSLIEVGQEPSELGAEPVSEVELILMATLEVALAYVVVGVPMRRTFREATARLGILLPTWRTPLVAVGFLVLAYLCAFVGGLLTDVFQPGVSEQLGEVVEDVTGEVQNPFGAVLLGICAGVGEEALFRGALQPRFGLVVTSATFALIHTQYGLSYVILGLFGVGIVLGLERRYFGTVAAMLTHAIFNAIAVLLQAYA